MSSHRSPVGPTARIVAGALYVAGFAIAAPAVHALLGTALDRHLPSPPINVIWRAAGVAGAFVGAALISAATIALAREGRGLPLSSSPPERLVTSGVYGLSRHPIYAGASLLFAALSLAVGDFWTAVVAGPLLAMFYLSYARGIEEPVLFERYGTAYAEYRQQAPFFLPFPFRRSAVQLTGRLLDSLSSVINRPGLWQRGQRILFWGYGLWPGLGVGFGLVVTGWILARAGLGPGAIAMTIALLTVAGLWGTRAAWKVTSLAGERSPRDDFSRTVGFVSWGAIAGMLAVAPLLAVLTGRGSLTFLDAAFSGLIVAHIFGRIGCAFYGCCHGKETVGPLRLHYSHPALKAVRQGRINPGSLLPVQLLSSICGAAIAAMVLWCASRGVLPPGSLASLTAALYGFCRFDEEWLRLPPRGFDGPLSPPQLAALVVGAAGLAGLFSIASPTAAAAPAGVPFVSAERVVVPALAALLTFFTFSYHRGAVGRW